MKKRIVKRITNVMGKELPIEKMEFTYVGKDNALGHFKGYGFLENYGPWNGYKVETEEIEKN